MTKNRFRVVRRRVFRALGLAFGVALLGVGGSAVVSGLRDYSPELQRPDLLIALGLGVLVWLGGASSEEGPLPES